MPSNCLALAASTLCAGVSGLQVSVNSTSLTVLPPWSQLDPEAGMTIDVFDSSLLQWITLNAADDWATCFQPPDVLNGLISAPPPRYITTLMCNYAMHLAPCGGTTPTFINQNKDEAKATPPLSSPSASLSSFNTVNIQTPSTATSTATTACNTACAGFQASWMLMQPNQTSSPQCKNAANLASMLQTNGLCGTPASAVGLPACGLANVDRVTCGLGVTSLSADAVSYCSRHATDTCCSQIGSAASLPVISMAPHVLPPSPTMSTSGMTASNSHVTTDSSTSRQLKSMVIVFVLLSVLLLVACGLLGYILYRESAYRKRLEFKDVELKTLEHTDVTAGAATAGINSRKKKRPSFHLKDSPFTRAAATATTLSRVSRFKQSFNPRDGVSNKGSFGSVLLSPISLRLETDQAGLLSLEAAATTTTTGNKDSSYSPTTPSTLNTPTPTQHKSRMSLFTPTVIQAPSQAKLFISTQGQSDSPTSPPMVYTGTVPRVPVNSSQDHDDNSTTTTATTTSNAAFLSLIEQKLMEDGTGQGKIRVAPLRKAGVRPPRLTLREKMALMNNSNNGMVSSSANGIGSGIIKEEEEEGDEKKQVFEGEKRGLQARDNHDSVGMDRVLVPL